MLEKNDLMAIGNLLDQKLDERFKEQDQKLDERFKEQDQKLDERFKEQDQKLDERFKEQDQRLDQGFKEFEKIMDKKLDKKLARTEKKLEKMDALLLDEIERNRNILEMRMDRMQQDINEVKTEVRQLYRITGQENERAEIEFVELHRKDSELDKRVTKLEKCAMA